MIQDNKGFYHISQISGKLRYCNQNLGVYFSVLILEYTLARKNAVRLFCEQRQSLRLPKIEYPTTRLEVT